MKLTTSMILVAALVGCEHKNKRDDQPPASSGGSSAVAQKPADDNMKPEPVNKETSPNPAPAGDEPKPPAAADLATYSKDIADPAKLTATIETSLGTIHCQLFGDKAPITVANFVGLATGKKPYMNAAHQLERSKPFYDGLIFHRVIPGFMIQGGDPEGVGRGGPGYAFDDEIDRSLKMGPGALAMANAGPGTNGSQFFIMEGARPDLVGHHTIFGQCKELDVVKKITGTPRDADDRPNTPVVINHITIGK
jgi:peptidyl-prolyl cis-trans isomerase A (cyclophilin A)